MPYITTDAPRRYHQISLEEVLNALPGEKPRGPTGNEGDTRTIYYKNLPARFKSDLVVNRCMTVLGEFVNRHRDLYEADRNTLYHTFYIPKHSHGYRRIDAPNEELKSALRELKQILEVEFRASHHTAAFAYAKSRSALSAVKRHQTNQSRWLLKIDFSDFFGSTTKEYVMKTLATIWPFSEVMEIDAGKELVENALDLAFWNDVLPQGTPISPMLTNLIMIPIDHYLFNTLRDHNGKHFIYTRYADDIDISCRVSFDWQEVITYIRSVIKEFDAPYVIKDEKTHYGSNAGRNWILGVMYNKDFDISIGHKRKEQLRAYLYSYIKDKKENKNWTLHEVQELNGQLAYLKSIEPKYFDGLMKHYGEKFSMNVIRQIRDDLRSL